MLGVGLEPIGVGTGRFRAGVGVGPQPVQLLDDRAASVRQIGGALLHGGDPLPVRVGDHPVGLGLPVESLSLGVDGTLLADPARGLVGDREQPARVLAEVGEGGRPGSRIALLFEYP